MNRIITFHCDHCGANAGEPCLSVGKKFVIAGPHMARAKAAGVYGDQGGDNRAALAELHRYAEDATAAVFGVPYRSIPERIRVRAYRERSVDPKKLWVKDAIAMLGGNRRKPESEQGALL